MYIPKHFNIKDSELILRIIKEFSFATLISNNNNEIEISHLPLIADTSGTFLTGHFAKANAHSNIPENSEIVAIFHGPHSYISPSWYETRNAVPTWNYVNIHVSGILTRLHSDELLNELEALIRTFEPDSTEYSLNDLSSENKERLINGIVGFKIEITKIDAKAKLSQNHSVERQSLVAEKLNSFGKENELYISKLMKENLKGHFR